MSDSEGNNEMKFYQLSIERISKDQAYRIRLMVPSNQLKVTMVRTVYYFNSQYGTDYREDEVLFEEISQ